MELTIYSILHIFTLLMAVFTGFLAYKKKNADGAKELLILMAVVSYWAIFVALESMATSQQSKIIFSKISYPAVLVTPVLMYLFVRRFTGHRFKMRFIQVTPFFVVPFITLLLCWTNELHGFIWSGFSTINSSTNLMVYNHGLAFWIGSFGYSYVMLALASYELIKYIFSNKSTFRSQGWLLLVGALIPWLGSLLAALKLNIVEGFDLTPSSLGFAGIFFIIAILNFRLLDLVPIAREALMKNVNEGILVLDDLDQVQDINAFAEQLLGIEMFIKPGTLLNAVENVDPYLLEAILSRKSYTTYEVNSGFSVKTYKISTIKLKTKPASRLVLIRDITELIEKQKEIQKSGKEYRDLYNVFRLMADNMPDLLWAKDLDKRYIFVNKAVCDSYLQASDTNFPIGKTREELMRIEREKYPDNPDWHNIGRYNADSDEVIIQTRKAGVFEEFGNIQGEFCYLDVRKAPIIDENGEMVGIVGSARDVSLQKKTEIELIAAKERAEEADRLKTSFLANMSHEVRTPMNSILGFITLMQETNPSEEEQKEYFAIVKQGGERLMNTINDIIDISRIDSGQMQLNLSETNITELNSLILALTLPDAKEKKLTLSMADTPLDTSILLKTDRNKLYTVLIKLLRNAIKYTKIGQVQFGCTCDDEFLNYFVKDTGIGIAKNRHNDIFNRFVQVDASINRDYEGSGLGLSLCKAYVEMMGGTIWLESEEGVGSTFYFRIPILPLTPDETKAYSKDHSKSFEPTQRLNILIVEDDPGSFEYLSLILKRAKHHVSHTFTGFEAVELCRQKNSFDVILMDVKLPGIDGYETTRRIRDYNTEIPILAVSAFAFTEDHERAIKAGCNDYITKPVNKDVLLRRLEQLKKMN